MGGKEIWAAESNAEQPTLKESPAIALKSGPQPFEVEFVRPAGLARLELRWQPPFIPAESLPFAQLGHLAKKQNAELEAGLTSDHGRMLFEELSCARCHQPAADDKMAKTLVQRQGPNLAGIGGRAYASWIDAWLADPHKLRPGTVMPKMFTDDVKGKAERYAVTTYLSTLGGNLHHQLKDILPNPSDLSRGKAFFTTTGCQACHQDVKPGENAGFYSRSVYPLANLGSKTRPEKLREYLQNPHAISPTGRMPNMTLQGNEAEDLAKFLCSSTDPTIPPDFPLRSKTPDDKLVEQVYSQAGAKLQKAAFDKLAITARWKDLGQHLFETKGCAHCHGDTKGDVVAPTRFKSVADIKGKATGCLSAKSPENPDVPRYSLSTADRDALLAFLKVGLSGAGSEAKSFQARQAITRFNCLNCHQRDGEGGISTALIEQMRKLEKTENADDVRPPLLTEVGHKLLTPWLRKVLVESGRARPWMSLRMPQFGEANVGFLSEALAKLDGTELESKSKVIEVTPARVTAGKLLVGKSGLGCIGCHDISGIPNFGTRGPDLATLTQRVRYDWYRHWLEVPQRMAPGTRMPQVIIEGKSMFPNVLLGDGDAQAEAMWAYVSLGPGLPLPVGLEPPKGLAVRVGDRPEVLRTFMPEAGNRAMAIGYPGGTSLAFDGNACRLTFGWSGNFLDMRPVWADRGGAPAKPMGPRFWTAPPGNPWAISGSNVPPNFVDRAKDPAYGATVPDLKMFKGKREVYFDGYDLDAKGIPTFHYRVGTETDAMAEITEKPDPIKDSLAPGIIRHLTIQAPENQGIWFMAGECSTEPKLFDFKGQPVAINLKEPPVEIDPANRLIGLPEGDKGIVLSAEGLPEGSKWHLLPRPGGGWQALVHIPPGKGKKSFDIYVWTAYRLDPAFLKSLKPEK